MDTTQTRTLEGATFIEDDTNSISSMTNDTDNLPLILWIKGDEPYAQDFCISADEAMKILGIKRSRLTQISGKELRVGRKRIDRYIKPFYRKKDLEEYLNWTRASASHIKSAEAINKAAEFLSQKAIELADTLNKKAQEYKNIIIDNFNLINNNINYSSDKILSHTSSSVHHISALLQDYIQNNINNSKNELLSVLFEIKNIINTINTNIQLISTIKKQNEEIQTRIFNLEENFKSFNIDTKENFAKVLDLLHQQNVANRDIAKALTILMQFFKENLKKQDILFQKMESFVQNSNTQNKKIYLIQKRNSLINIRKLNKRRYFASKK